VLAKALLLAVGRQVGVNGGTIIQVAAEGQGGSAKKCWGSYGRWAGRLVNHNSANVEWVSMAGYTPSANGANSSA